MTEKKDRPSSLKAATTPGMYVQILSEDTDGFCGCLSGRLEICQSHNEILEESGRISRTTWKQKELLFQDSTSYRTTSCQKCWPKQRMSRPCNPTWGSSASTGLEFGADPGSTGILSMISGLFRYKGLMQCLQRTGYIRRGRNRVAREESEGQKECREMVRRR